MYIIGRVNPNVCVATQRKRLTSLPPSIKREDISSTWRYAYKLSLFVVTVVNS